VPQKKNYLNGPEKPLMNKKFKKSVNERTKKTIKENHEKNELIKTIQRDVEEAGGTKYVKIEQDSVSGDMQINELNYDGFTYTLVDPMKYHNDLKNADLQRAHRDYMSHNDDKKYLDDISKILGRTKPESIGDYNEEKFMTYNKADINILNSIVDYIENENEYNDSLNSKNDDEDDEDFITYYDDDDDVY
jgi:hypothetical protein